MTANISYDLDPHVTRSEISRRLCGNADCPGVQKFLEIGIEPLAWQAREIQELNSRPCCGGPTCRGEKPKPIEGDPCRGVRRCDINTVTELPEVKPPWRPPTPPLEMCRNPDCPVAIAIEALKCRPGKACDSPDCPYGSKDVKTQTPKKIPCGLEVCPYSHDDDDGTGCGKPGCHRKEQCVSKWVYY